MKWFGTKAAQGDARPVLARAWGSGAVALGEWPSSYEAQVRAGVVGNPVAQRAMRLVSEGAGSAALKVVGVEDGARVTALIARASAGQGLVETLASHLLLHGNGYVQVIAGADGTPAELFALRPERVSVEADARGWPMAGERDCAGICGGGGRGLRHREWREQAQGLPDLYHHGGGG